MRVYFWDEGLDYSMNTFYKDIYTKRRYFKDLKNQLQEAYELFRNSRYGKIIQKITNEETKYMDDEETEKFVRITC